MRKQFLPNYKKMKKLRLILLCLFCLVALRMSALIMYDGSHAVSYHVNGKSSPVVGVALDMLGSDMEQVTGARAVSEKNGVIQVYQLDRNMKLKPGLSLTGI